MKETELESLIIKEILCSKDFMRAVIPFIKTDYFAGTHNLVFDQLVKFVVKYNKTPTLEALSVELQSSSASNDQYVEAAEFLTELEKMDSSSNPEWLYENTEKWCQDRAIHNAILESIRIIDGKHETLQKGALPDLLQKALSVSFDANVGHDYFEDAELRYDLYNRESQKLSFDLEWFNKITESGVEPGTLNVILAGTGVGKSLTMCHFAAANISEGKNVLYLTMEMAEEKISERIDANLMNVDINKIKGLGKEIFLSKINNVIKRLTKSHGKLIVKQYPTGAPHVGHFRALLNELLLKKNFKPDVIYVDYLNICSSARIKMGGSVNTYSLVKSIAEELRGLAIEFGVPIFSATQTTRSGFSNSDVAMEDISESFGLAHTADMLFAMIITEELRELNQILVKQLKNRYTDAGKNTRFVIGVDRPKMKLYDVDDSAQDIIGANQAKEEDQPISTFGNRERPDFGGIQI